MLTKIEKHLHALVDQCGPMKMKCPKEQGLAELLVVRRLWWMRGKGMQLHKLGDKLLKELEGHPML
jgi:hypothetical protein